MLQNHQRYRRREAYERRGLYLRAAPTGAYLRTERMRAGTTTRSRHYDVDDACADNHPIPTQRMRETTAVDEANGPAAPNTVARPTRRSTPCLRRSVDQVDRDADLVATGNTQAQPTTQTTEAYVTRAFAEAEREAAAERAFAEAEREAEAEWQIHRERVMKVIIQIPLPDRRMRETTTVVGATRTAAQDTVAKRPTQTPTRQSAPCLSHSVDLSDDDVELVTATNPQTHPATQNEETYVTRAFAEAERVEAEERQVHREGVRRVRYPTPRLPLQIPRSLSPDSPRESLSVSPTAA